MNIVKEQVDSLNAVLKVHISKEDYEPNVQKTLTDYKKKARIDGFRPGKVPAGLIQKMYGKQAMLEEVNKLLSESVTKYLTDQSIHILGDPLPSEKEQALIDWDQQTEFDFAFDLGLSPEFDLNLTKKDKLNFYNITPAPKVIENYLDGYLRRYGSFKTCDIVADGKESVTGNFIELNEDGSIKDSGVVTENSVIYLEFMKDEAIKKEFMGLKIGDTVTYNLRKAFPNDVELASILHKKKEEVGPIDSDFQMTINAISQFEKAALNQELFDKVFGEGEIKSETEFNEKIQGEIKNNLLRESEYKFRMDVKEALLLKADFKLPEDFLKRWIFSINEGKYTLQQIEDDFPKFMRDLRWQLMQNKVIKEHNLQVSDEEMIEFAKYITRMQFEQYGLHNVPDENIDNYAKESLKRPEERKRMLEKKYEDKVIDFVKTLITMEEKVISSEDFDKLMEDINE
jgi:trigger factor